MIRTVVSAASVLARDGLAAIVRGDARLALVAATSPVDVEAAVTTFAPDVLLEDRGVDRVPLAVPSVALVDDPRGAWLGDRLDASDRGAHAILARDASAREIVGALVAVAAGLVAIQPRALDGAEIGQSASIEIAQSASIDRLTARERVVLGELARGVPNKTIGVRLGISEHTVKFHVASIFAKLAVSSRTEAVARGVRLGLIML